MMEIKTIQKYGYDFIYFKQGNFEVEFTDLGASIVSVKIDGKFMTLTPEKHKDFILPQIYHGKTIGRVCNRLPGNSVCVDGKKYNILNNEGDNTLHGGVNGISRQKFSYEIKNTQDFSVILFKYLSKHLESGFPGNLNLTVKYVISYCKIEIYFEASTDQKTMCSLTNHTFYCCGENSLDNLNLQINSHKFLHPNPNDLLPTEIRDVDKAMDFSNCKTISNDIENSYLINSKTNGYDHYFYFDKIDILNPQCILKGKEYTLEFFTDFSGVQIYTDNYEDGIKFSGCSSNKRRGIAIEPSESQKDLHYLDKNEKYNHFITVVFKKN